MQDVHPVPKMPRPSARLATKISADQLDHHMIRDKYHLWAARSLLHLSPGSQTLVAALHELIDAILEEPTLPLLERNSTHGQRTTAMFRALTTLSFVRGRQSSHDEIRLE